MFFRSKFAKLEALVATKAEERTAEQLQAAQAELDNAQAGVILVPKTDTITSSAALQAHIDGLEKQATDAKAAAATATAEAEKAQKALTDLRGTRVVDDARATSDKGDGGDKHTEDAAEKAKAKVTDPNRKWNAKADEMGIGAPPAEAPKSENA